MVKVRNQQSGEGGAEDANEGGGADVGDDLKMVCRPKVGGMVVGGGFFALFRKLDIMQSGKEEDAAGGGKLPKGVEKSAAGEKNDRGRTEERQWTAWIRKFLGF